MKKYILYTRVGSKEQSRIGASIESQLRLLKHFAKQKKLQVGEVLWDFGSTTSKRAGFERMLEMLSNDEAQGIITIDYERLSRDIITTARLTRLIGEKRLELLTLHGTYTHDPESLLVLTIMGGFAEFERGKRSESIKNGLMQRRPTQDNK